LGWERAGGAYDQKTAHSARVCHSSTRTRGTARYDPAMVLPGRSVPVADSFSRTFRLSHRNKRLDSLTLRRQLTPPPDLDLHAQPHCVRDLPIQGLYGAAFAAVLETPETKPPPPHTQRRQNPGRPHSRTPSPAAHADVPQTQPRRARNCSAARQG
jgi:hypothetical protein